MGTLLTQYSYEGHHAWSRKWNPPMRAVATRRSLRFVAMHAARALRCLGVRRARTRQTISYGAADTLTSRARHASSSSKGTTFQLTLPRRVLASPQTETVLIVDDDDAMRASLARALTSAGFHVLTAAGGAEAVTTLRARPDVGVAVLDVNLPDMNGFELAQKLEADGKRLGVIFMSGAVEARVQADIRAKPFLAKPFSNEELARRVRSAGKAA